MLWAVLSVLAAFIFAVAMTVDKFILTRWIRNPLTPLTTFTIVSSLAGLSGLLALGCRSSLPSS